MNPETVEYCQDAGPFGVTEGHIGEWRVVAHNREPIATTDDNDVAYYLADALNAVGSHGPEVWSRKSTKAAPAAAGKKH